MFERTAHVYDLVYDVVGKDYRAESEAIEQLVRARVPEARSLLDVACGTGRHLVHLRERFDVAGVDVDEHMLAVGRDRLGGDVELVVGDMRDVELDRRFDVVTCLFSSVGYLPDAAALAEAIGNMARHLRDGGVLVVDGWVRPDAWRDPGTVHVVSGVRDGVAVARVARTERYGAKTVLEMHHLVGDASAVEHLVDRHELTLFTSEEYERAFAAAGLEVEVVESPMPDRDRYVGMVPGAATS